MYILYLGASTSHIWIWKIWPKIHTIRISSQTVQLVFGMWNLHHLAISIDDHSPVLMWTHWLDLFSLCNQQEKRVNQYSNPFHSSQWNGDMTVFNLMHGVTSNDLDYLSWTGNININIFMFSFIVLFLVVLITILCNMVHTCLVPSFIICCKFYFLWPVHKITEVNMSTHRMTCWLVWCRVAR